MHTNLRVINASCSTTITFGGRRTCSMISRWCWDAQWLVELACAACSRTINSLNTLPPYPPTNNIHPAPNAEKRMNNPGHSKLEAFEKRETVQNLGLSEPRGLSKLGTFRNSGPSIKIDKYFEIRNLRKFVTF